MGRHRVSAKFPPVLKIFFHPSRGREPAGQLSSKN